jgi:hypothetical protein
VYNDTTTTYDKGDQVLASFVPETETLLLFAIDSSTFSPVALSEQYPKDVIYYEADDNLTEDGLRSRDGFIQFRHDTENNLSAWFDWRNVLNRRYTSDQTIDIPSWDTYATNLSDGYDIDTTDNHALPLFSSEETTFFAGGFQMAATGQIRDFKTFVGLGETGTNDAYYKNIEIDLTHSGTFVGGSGGGSTIPAPTNDTRIPNVVILAASAYDIKIGANCNGINIMTRDIRNIEIGNTNQNMYLGGLNGVSLSAPGFPYSIQGYLENIKVGNTNRNVVLSEFLRNCEIGNSNTGIAISYDSSMLKIGNENNNIFMSLVHNVSMQDRNKDVVMFYHQNLEIKDFGNTIRIYGGAQNIVDNGSSLGTAPYPIAGPATFYASTIDGTSVIHNNVSNVDIGASNHFVIGSNTDKVFMSLAKTVRIGEGCFDILVYQSNNINIAESCTRVDVGGDISSDVNVAKNCSNVSVGGTAVDIGSGCTNITAMFGCIDIIIGPLCSSVYVTGTIGTTVEYGSQT